MVLEWSPLRLGLALDALDAEQAEADDQIRQVAGLKDRPDIVYTVPLSPG
jgi:hypothetical protein